MTVPTSIQIFTACAEKYALRCVLGEMETQWSVDVLQAYAEERGLVAEIGQDKVQDVMAAAFMWARAFVSGEEDEPVDFDYAQRLVRDWELDDPRDRWRWTGELPPPPEKEPAPRPRPVPQSTVDAFAYVVSLGDPDRLRAWLRTHGDVAPTLISEAA